MSNRYLYPIRNLIHVVVPKSMEAQNHVQTKKK